MGAVGGGGGGGGGECLFVVLYGIYRGRDIYYHVKVIIHGRISILLCGGGNILLYTCIYISSL